VRSDTIERSRNRLEGQSWILDTIFPREEPRKVWSVRTGYQASSSVGDFVTTWSLWSLRKKNKNGIWAAMGKRMNFLPIANKQNSHCFMARTLW
jgi:hypothetical protein